ncbi:MAG TPA: hypothetical protein VKZ59_00695 [Acidobacteriota bacterium]|nr:hypothetical protein [Acidobacteriota bacterium]
MKRITFLIAFFVFIAAVPTSLSAQSLKVGTSRVVITPPEGHPMGGSYQTRLNEGTVDDLYAKTLFLESGGERVALVALDLVAISDQVVSQARSLIEDRVGISGDRVMISATHTHSGPVIAGRHSLDPYIGGDLEIAQKWIAELPGLIAQSVEEASKSLVEATISAGSAIEESFVFNRRFLMKSGKVGWNPGRGNPDVVRPAGPVDPELAILFVQSKEDSVPLATYLNYPLHVAVAGGLKYSADFPGVVADLLSKAKGEQMLTLFTEGTAGNINQVDVKNPDQLTGLAASAKIGAILAQNVLKSYPHLVPVEPKGLRVRREVLNLEPAQFTQEEVEQARQIAENMKSETLPPFLKRVHAFKILNVLARNRQPRAEVQVVSLGDQLAWVALPGEIFVELGMAIKQASPFPHTIVVSLANGWLSYVPDRKAFAEGNYEPLSSIGAPGSGERMVDAATRLLIENFKDATNIRSTHSLASR